MIYIPKQNHFSAMLGKIEIETVSMARCACVSCNSCTCACACRGIASPMKF